jgi:hypothetical protein
MLRVVIAAALVAGCRISLENADNSDAGGSGRKCTVNMSSQPCLDAAQHQDFAWLQANVLTPSCAAFRQCHNEAMSPASKLYLQTGKAFAALVNASSTVDTARKFVVPNDVSASYLMFMLQDLPAAMATPPVTSVPKSGYMPQSSPPLCCQKLDALERWINAGAPNN